MISPTETKPRFRLRYLKRPAATCSMIGAAIIAARLDDVVLWGHHANLTVWAYPLMLLGSLAWIGVGIITRDLWVLAQWGFFTALNVIGIWRWS